MDALKTYKDLTPERFDELLRTYADAYVTAVTRGKPEDIEATTKAYLELRKVVFP